MIFLKDFTYTLKPQNKPLLNIQKLVVYPKKNYALIGSSGSGKSSLLRIFAQYIQPTAGHFLSEYASSYVQLIPQKPLFSFTPHMSMKKYFKAHSEEILSYLQLFALDKRTLDLRPSQLSGGQIQRYAVIRALLMKPKLLLCDEILSDLDPLTSEKIIDVIKSLNTQIIWVTHNLDELDGLVDEVWVLEEGKVTAELPISRLYESGSNAYVDKYLKGYSWLKKMTSGL